MFEHKQEVAKGSNLLPLFKVQCRYGSQVANRLLGALLGEGYVHSSNQVEPMLLSSCICLPEFLYRTYVAVGEEGTSIIKAKILGPCHISNTSDY